MNNNEIPIIEVVPNKGYWEIYPDKKIWHDVDDRFKNMKFKDYNEAGKKYGMGSDWLNLQDGDNKVRLVSEFEDYGTHSVEYNDEQGNKKFKMVVCIGKEDCQYCQQGDKPRVQFLGWVIDRNDGQMKLLRIGYKIFQQIGELAKSEEYAFDGVPDYDINIRKSGQGLKTEYTVIAARENTEITEEEQKEIDTKANPPAEIIERMKEKVEAKEETDT